MKTNALPIVAAIVLASAVPLNAAPGDSPATATASDVAVTVTFANGSPKDVLFDDGRETSLDPDATKTRYTGRRSAVPPRSHLLIVRYDDDDLPLMLRMTPGMKQIDLRVFHATDAACSGTAVETLSRDSHLASSTGQKIEVMFRGRRMYRVPDCSYWIRRIAAQVYFTLNCDLAKKHEFLDLTDDAKTWFVDSAAADRRNAAKAEVAACVDQAHGRSIRDLLAFQSQLSAPEQAADSASVDAMLATFARDPDWAGGFTAVRVNRSAIAERSE